MLQQKEKIITYGLGAIGVLMILLGVMKGMPPPMLTGVGFLLLTWGRL